MFKRPLGTRCSRRHLLTAAAAWGLLPRATLAHEYYALMFTLIHPWTPPTAAGQSEARIHFRLESITGDDRLLGARFLGAQSVEMRDGPDDARPPLAFVDIMPGNRMDFLPDRTHLLLRGLHQPLLADRSYPLELRFQRSGTLIVMMSMSGVD